MKPISFFLSFLLTVSSATANLITNEEIRIQATATVDRYNRQLHQTEIEKIKEIAKKWAEEENLTEEEATKRLARELIWHVDKDWHDALAADGYASDEQALEYLANGFTDMGGSYVYKEQRDDGPPDIYEDGEGPVFTPDDIREGLVNYSKNYTSSYNNKFQNSDGLGGVFGKSEKYDFYDQYLNLRGDSPTNMVDIVIGNIEGSANWTKDEINSAKNFLNLLYKDPETAITAFNHGVMNLPNEIAEIYEDYNKMDTERNLYHLQGDDKNAGRVTAEFSTGAVLGIAGTKGVGKLPNLPDKPNGAVIPGKDAIAQLPPNIKNWNQFQTATKGQYASRADAAKGWALYKETHGIPTGGGKHGNLNIGGTNIRNIDPVDANSGFDKPPYNPDKPIVDFDANGKDQYVRVYNQGPNSNPIGQWMMKEDDIRGLTPQEIKDKFDLPELPTHIVDVKPPSGLTIRVGEVNRDNFGGAGGGTQFQLIDKTPREAFANNRPIGQ